ncbi:MAG: hypothetical protein IPF92_27455 [Myxococcales bacterium]|nr:hypothetical protein [Myxococcales bacterium]
MPPKKTRTPWQMLALLFRDRKVIALAFRSERAPPPSAPPRPPILSR